MTIFDVFFLFFCFFFCFMYPFFYIFFFSLFFLEKKKKKKKVANFGVGNTERFDSEWEELGARGVEVGESPCLC